MTDINPTAIAEERYPTFDRNMIYTGYDERDRKAYAACITERELPLRERIAELEAEARWIPTSERLPENRATVLAFFRHGEQDVCFFYDGHWSGHSASTVTHWKPLPQPPTP